LYDLRELGFSNLTGIDPYARAPVSSEGFSIRRASLDDVNERFDVIMFNHSLEHLTDPKHALLTSATLLNSGGMLVIRIPLTGGWAWRAYGGEWAQLDAPRHIHLFSEQGFTSLAERAGWRLAGMLYDSGTLQFTGSQLRLAGINYHTNPRELEARFSRAQLRDFALHAESLNRGADGDMATFFLVSL
jgi:SAM-dependent methyltransferase